MGLLRRYADWIVGDSRYWDGDVKLHDKRVFLVGVVHIIAAPILLLAQVPEVLALVFIGLLLVVAFLAVAFMAGIFISEAAAHFVNKRTRREKAKH